VIRHVVVGAAPGLDQDAFERKLYVIRRLAELAAGPDLVVPSFSSRTLVYKGMLTAPQLAGYYPDLVDPRFESALAHATSEDLESDFGQGVLLIHRQLTDLWRKHGLREVDTAGGFDPNHHEAVTTEPSSEPANSVLEVLRKGYTLGDRLIRPALVKVAVRPDESSAPGRKKREG
jgi:hypothetical protein